MKKDIDISNEVIKEVLPFMIKTLLHGVYGKAGCGKTTFCMHIIGDYLAQNKKVIYIDTENGFFIERMIQILKISDTKENTLKNLLLRKVFDLNELRNAIKEAREVIKSSQHEIGIIVIDSLSNPYRVEMKENSQIWEINRIMGKTIHELKKIAFHHNIPILATHQVYTDFDTGTLEIVGRDLVKYDFKVLVFIEESFGKRYLKLVRHPFIEEREISAVIKKEGFKKKKLI